MRKKSPVRVLHATVRRRRPVLVFLAGPNGAGKSTFHRCFLAPLGLPFVNADVIASELRAARGAPGRGIDRIAFERADAARRAFVRDRTSFCTETVFSDPVGAKLGLLRTARHGGFHVILVFLGLDSPELCVARVVQRVATGGHDVPDEKLLERYPRTLANLRAAIPIVDEAFLFDNSSDLEPFRLVAIYRAGHLAKRGRVPARWAEGLPGL